MTKMMPNRKITVGGFTGAITAIGVWVASLYDVIIPGDIAVAISTALSFVMSWLTPDE